MSIFDDKKKEKKESKLKLQPFVSAGGGSASAAAGGTPTLTATYIGFGDGSNLLTGADRLTWNNTTRDMTLTHSSGRCLITLNGTSDESAIAFGSGNHPGSGGGVLLPFVGGGQAGAPGIWWTSNAYGSTSGIWLSLGFNFQGAGSSTSPIKFRKGTGTSSDGSIIFEFRPDDGYVALNPHGVAAGNTAEIRFLELAANGTEYFGIKAPDALATSRIIVLPSDDPVAADFLKVTSFAGGIATLEWAAGSGGAPTDATYVTLTTNATLTNERTLTGTSNQITITDGGAGLAVTLSTPQDIHTSATPQFARLGLGVAADAVAPFKITQPVATSGSPNVIIIGGGTHTTLAADTEASDVLFNLNRTVQFTAGGGAFNLQRIVRFRAPTLSATSAETIGEAVTLYADSPIAGTNMTLTSSLVAHFLPSANAHNGLLIENQGAAPTGLYLSMGPTGDTTQVKFKGAVTGGANVVDSFFANATLLTTDTAGFIHYPSSAGVPAGVPANIVTNVIPTVIDRTNNRLYIYNGGVWVNVAGKCEIGLACSDESTALTAGTTKITFRMPYAMTVTAVRATLSTTQTSGSIFTVDINDSGTTILSTKLTIDNGEKTSTTAVTAAVISDSALADDAEITVDIDQIGDGTAKGLKIWLIGTRT